MESLLKSPYTWIILVVSIAIIWWSYTLNVGDNDWYESLRKPYGVIPNSWFAWIWGFLYIAIVIGAIVAAHKYKGCKKMLTLLYVVILLLTLAWIYAFSVYHMMSTGMAILLLTILFTLMMLVKINPKAMGGCLIPFVAFGLFFLWILVASYYNLGILWLNPEEDQN